MEVGIGFMEIIIVVGGVLGLGILGAIIYAVTKGGGNGPGND